MRVEFSRFGPKYDYRGAHVTIEWQGRTLLGEIKAIWRNEQRGIVLCRIQHFCGDWWPVEPALSALNILDRMAR